MAVADLDPEELLAVLRALAPGAALPLAGLAAAAGVPVERLEQGFRQLVEHGVRQRRDGSWRRPGGLELLEASSIHGRLRALDGEIVPVQVEGIVGSTNDIARQLLAQREPPFLVVAEAQTAGRGRRGRQWQSPVAANLYWTLVVRLPGGIDASRGLSLVVGVAAAEAVATVTGVDVALKWPNDLLVDGRKLGGILVELVPAERGYVVIIGIGLNVAMPGYEASRIDQRWIDLSTAVQAPVSRNHLAAALLASHAELLARFRRDGFSPALARRWMARDAFHGRPVVAQSDGEAWRGIEAGVNEAGELLLQTAAGEMAIGAGDVSLRLDEEAQ